LKQQKGGQVILVLWIAARANGRRGLKQFVQRLFVGELGIAARANGRRGLKQVAEQDGRFIGESPPVQTGGAD